jgi:cytochrome P450
MGEAIRCAPFYPCFVFDLTWKVLGPVVYVELPGTSMVILNSYEVAQDLLSKHPNNTAGRRIGCMITEVYVSIVSCVVGVLNCDGRMGWKWRLALLDSGPSHSNQRKMLRKGIGPQRLGGHNPIIERITAKLMLELRDFKGDPPSLVMKCVDLS